MTKQTDSTSDRSRENRAETSQVLINLGFELMGRGQYDEALQQFDEAVSRFGYAPSLHYYRAKCLKSLGRFLAAEQAAVSEDVLNPSDFKTLALLAEIRSNPIYKNAMLSNPVTQNRQPVKTGRAGIIVFGHTRTETLLNLLESLRRQKTGNDVHVWLDGHHGRLQMKAAVTQCRDAVSSRFPEVHLCALTGHHGIEKMTLDGLEFMAARYDRIIVLEDDCFPTADAVYEFEKALDEIESNSNIYSVYGHHFLCPAEGATITRFQGWGWATTCRKLMPILSEMKRCIAMSEREYLQFVRANMTPRVVERLDVTPGRDCVNTIVSHFCWDGCTCLLTAMRGLSHKRTEKRVIYNCGMGDGSTHFADDGRFRKPPFNMIRVDEVWNYFGVPLNDESVVVTSVAVGGPHGDQNSKPKPSGTIQVDGYTFTDIVKSEFSETYVGFSEETIIKIEHERHERKRNDLNQEIEIIRYLNEKGCMSCPRLISDGRLDTGQRYFIQQRIYEEREFNHADMVFSIIEQKTLGVCQGDFKKNNFIFDKQGICNIIDYDQASIDERYIEMRNLDYLDWFARQFEDRWKIKTDFYAFCGYDRKEIVDLFRNQSFDLAKTTLMKEQVTTDTDTGIYHKLEHKDIFIEGVRSIAPRLGVLDQLDFRNGERVLDVGCNMGVMCHYLTDRGGRVTGIDMDPMIVKAAKMVANIVEREIDFFHHDLDSGPIVQSFDTICLFSVIHHAKDFPKAAANVADRCNRIIVEAKLLEAGSKFHDGKWQDSSGWQCADVAQLSVYLEKAFVGFQFEKFWGSVDRDRHILTFVRAADGIEVGSKDARDAHVESGKRQ